MEGGREREKKKGEKMKKNRGRSDMGQSMHTSIRSQPYVQNHHSPNLNIKPIFKNVRFCPVWISSNLFPMLITCQMWSKEGQSVN